MFLPLLLIALIVYLISHSMKNSTGIRNQRISENFTLGELIHTNTGLRNVPNWEQIANLKFVVDNFLQPLRSYYNKPIFVTSGFRSEEVNKAIGGSSSSSQHMKGEAIDFAMPGVSNDELIDTAISLGLPYDQLLDERLYNTKGIRKNWIHVSLRSSHNNRFQRMIVRNTKENLKAKYIIV